ncbi:MAG: C-type lectin domain-containing protein, partial [Clostridia bacterium]|nr:C-type lectin domain-containing protein [Clostridia bacterium]
MKSLKWKKGIAWLLVCVMVLAGNAVFAESTELEGKPVISYTFDGSLKDETGNSTISADFEDYEGEESRMPLNNGSFFAEDESGEKCWQWDSAVSSGGGFNLKMRSVLSNPEIYTIAMTFSLNNTGNGGNGYRKILHFGDYDEDSGFYFYQGGLCVYYGGRHGLSEMKFADGQKLSLVVTRTEEGIFTAYVHDGTRYRKAYTYEDKSECTEIQRGRLGFFYDDNKGVAGEASPGGKLYDLKIYDDAMTETDICGDFSRGTFGGHTYQVFPEYVTPPEAERLCDELGGHLVTITSQEEHDFVNALAKDNGVTLYTIGATDRAVEGQWEWMTGEVWDYTNWNASIEPNNGLGSGENYCVVDENRSWKWVDVFGGYDNETTTASYVCEWDSYRTSYESSVS